MYYYAEEKIILKTVFKMASSSNVWEEDEALKNDLKRYIQQRLQRCEILDFVMKNYPYYKWSIRTLDRRLRFFNIKYIDRGVSLEEARDAISTELNGPGRLLGYRAMHLKLRQKHGLNLPRDTVYALMAEADPEGLHERRPGPKKKKKKTCFVSRGPDWVLSVDGHDKLMGYQNSTFPIAIYGCIDTASRRILWLKAGTTNSNPELIGRWYFDYLYECRKVPNYLRMDKGTETGVMATMQCFLRQNHGDLDNPIDSVIYGPSTSNQVCKRQRNNIL